jgi:glycosyltransferase involved in cell wall biosynthesis
MYLGLVGRFDFIEVNDLAPLPWAIIVKILSFGKPKIIYDCHEFETEVQKFNNNPFKKKLYGYLEWFCVKFASDVICVSDSIASEYQKRYNIKKPYLVMNCPFRNHDITKNDYFRKKFNIKETQKIFLYQGGIITGRGVEDIITTFENLDNSYVVIFMGYGNLVNAVKKAGQECNRVFYHESVPLDVLLSYTSSADFGLCLVPNICRSYYFGLPNKLFEYIQSGLPCLATPLFEIKSLIEKEKIGTVTSDFSISSLTKGVKVLAAMDYGVLKFNCNLAADKYSWEEQEKTLKEIFKKYMT